MNYLSLAAVLSFIAAFMHVLIVFGGPEWYRFFGAGEEMAALAEAGEIRPAIITLGIALVLSLWGVYALSGASVLPTLPLLKTALILITAVYLLRGILGFLGLFFSDHPTALQNTPMFWFWSSVICLAIGVVHLKGVADNWSSWS